MRVIIQRVSSASVVIHGRDKRSIGQGFVILFGVCNTDTTDDLDWIVKKTISMRLFNDAAGKINLSLADVDGEVLLVSQFTLFASTRKGNRPSFNGAGSPSVAVPLYEAAITAFETALNKPIATGEFGAEMQVEIHNDGPVTIMLDSKVRE